MTLHILNPNSSRVVTDGIDAAIDPMRAGAGVDIRCHLLPEGPAGIETQAHVDGVVLPLLAQARALEDEASAFVIACFSDPGLAALREQSARPVLGIGESAYLTALTLGQRFGIVSIKRGSVARHIKTLGAMGILDRLAADRPIDLGVAELSDETRTRARLEEVGARLRDADGADVLILGCAGMAGFRRDLQMTLGIPVIDPCQAATAMALGRIAHARCD
jgi:allantoin racemase